MLRTLTGIAAAALLLAGCGGSSSRDFHLSGHAFSVVSITDDGRPVALPDTRPTLRFSPGHRVFGRWTSCDFRADYRDTSSGFRVSSSGDQCMVMEAPDPPHDLSRAMRSLLRLPVAVSASHGDTVLSTTHYRLVCRPIEH